MENKEIGSVRKRFAWWFVDIEKLDESTRYIKKTGRSMIFCFVVERLTLWNGWIAFEEDNQ